MFESEDEKKARVKSILQLLILREALDNVGTEEYLKEIKTDNEYVKIKENTYEYSAKKFLKEAKKLCFDYFVDHDLTDNFSDKIQGNSKATEEDVEKKIAEIIEKKAKELKALKESQSKSFDSLEKILTSKLQNSIITDGFIIDDKSASNKTRAVINDLFTQLNKTNIATEKINLLNSKFSLDQEQGFVEQIGSNSQKFYSQLLTTTSTAFGFINLAIKDISKSLQSCFSDKSKNTPETTFTNKNSSFKALLNEIGIDRS